MNFRSVGTRVSTKFFCNRLSTQRTHSVEPHTRNKTQYLHGYQLQHTQSTPTLSPQILSRRQFCSFIPDENDPDLQGLMNPVGVTSKAELDEQIKLAEEGDPIALYRLGNSYLFGVQNLIEKDPQRGLELLKQSGQRGSAEAYRDIGDHYKMNNDQKSAVEWYLRAAEMGDSLSQWEAATAYEAGDGVEKNLSKAVYWYRESAIGGDERSKHNLGVLHLFGEGVEKNERLALKLFTEAAEGGIPEAYYHLGILHLKQQSIVKAKVALEIASKLEVPAAQYNLALLYSNQTFGDPGERCKWQKEAFRWLQKAAEFLPQANLLLANRHLFGVGTTVNIEKGVALLKECAEEDNKDPETLISLAVLTAAGLGTDQHFDTSRNYVRELIQLTSSDPQSKSEQYSSLLNLSDYSLLDELISLWSLDVHPQLFSDFQQRQMARLKHYHTLRIKKPSSPVETDFFEKNSLNFQI